MAKIRHLSLKLVATTIVLGIAYLVYSSLVMHWDSYIIRIQIDASKSPTNASMIVYYNSNRGYNGNDFQICQKSASSEGASYFIDLKYQKLKGFRVDPGVGKGEWFINNIKILLLDENESYHRVIYKWDAESIKKEFAPWHSISQFDMHGGNLQVAANGPDPYFGYIGKKTISALMAENPSIAKIEQNKIISISVLGTICLLWFVLLWKSDKVFDRLTESRAWKRFLDIYSTLTQNDAGDQERSWKYNILRWLLGASNLHAFLIYLMLAAFVLGANPFKGETVSPVDLLLAHTGYHSIHKSVGFSGSVVHRERGDVIDGTYPGWTYLKKHLRDYRFPKWNLNVHSPINISIFSIIFNPTMLSFMAVKDSAYGIYLGGLLQLTIAGFGVYLLMRVFISFPGAFFGGIVYMMSGFNTAWFFVLTTGIWIPWVFWAVARYLESGKQLWGLAVTLTSLCLILSYFYAVAGWTFYAVSLFILFWNLFYFSDWKSFVIKNIQPILFIGLAFIIAFSSFMPTFDQLDRADLSSRFNTGPLPASYLNLLADPFFLNLLRAEFTVYTGTISLILTGFVIFVFFQRSEKKQYLISVFGGVLLFLTLSIVFGFFKTSWVKLIPLFNFNPWNRLFSIIGFCFAILSAIGLDRLLFFLKNRIKLNSVILMVFVLLLMRYQILDQKEIFNRFNAIVKTSWFYPETETLKYVKENIRPLQTVIADGAYFVGGTLGVYGIPEWFGHNTYTNIEKKLINQLLRSGWASPYVPGISGSKINYTSSLMNAFGVRYILLVKQPLAILNDDQFNETFRVSQPEEKILLLENLKAPSGAYFIKDLTLSPEKIVTKGVNALVENDSNIIIRSTIKEAGWLVLPIKFFPGWQAFANSKKLKIKKYLGVFPAIPVDGTVKEIRYEYHPKTHILGSFVSIAGVVLFLILGIVFYSRTRKSDHAQ
jgi:hypothetical protein